MGHGAMTRGTRAVMLGSEHASVQHARRTALTRRAVLAGGGAPTAGRRGGRAGACSGYARQRHQVRDLGLEQAYEQDSQALALRTHHGPFSLRLI